MKTGKAAVVVLGALVVLCSTGYAQSTGPKPAADTFLRNWLVRKDAVKTRYAFARGAFSNKLFLSEGCGGFVTDKDRANAKTVETSVIRLLKYVAHNAIGKTLNSKLKHQQLANGDVLKGQVLASMERDGYALVKGTDFGIEEEAWKYLKTTFHAKSYAALLVLVRVKQKDGVAELPLYFIWALQNGSWKIIHAGMQCA